MSNAIDEFTSTHGHTRLQTLPTHRTLKFDRRRLPGPPKYQKQHTLLPVLWVYKPLFWVLWRSRYTSSRAAASNRRSASPEPGRNSSRHKLFWGMMGRNDIKHDCDRPLTTKEVTVTCFQPNTPQEAVVLNGAELQVECPFCRRTLCADGSL